jgi:peroxiredoxin
MDRRRLIAGLVVGLVTAAVAAYALWPRSALDEVTFITLKGERLRLRDLRGKIVLVNFWATTCPACVKEMPELVQTYRQYHRRGLEIIAVAMSYDPLVFVKEFAEKHALPFPVALDLQQEAAKAFGGVKVVPTTFVLDKDGRLVSRTLGLIAFDRLRVFLDEQLGR